MRIFINNRNLLTWPKAMAERLISQGHEVIFVDNGSTYRPLLEWYETKDIEVIRSHNIGPPAPWHVMGKQSEPYVVTDPDLDISDIPDDWPEVLLTGLGLRGVKCGFSLRDDDLPENSTALTLDESDDGEQGGARMQSQAWGTPIEHGGRVYYGYPVDTTFAVYDPLVTVHQIGGCRTGPPYTARHLPWYLTELDEEMHQYLETAMPYTAQHSGSSMVTLKRVREMMRTYEKRRDA